MEPLYACLLAVLEMTFVFVVLLLLHDLRKVIGFAGLYISMGLLFAFTEILGAANMQVITGYPGLNFNITSTVLMLPFLCALMVIYIADGTMETQRLIIALMAGLGVYTYLASITVSQIDWNVDGAQGIVFIQQVSDLLKGSMRSMSASVVSFAIDIFLLPILYQRLRNYGCRLFFCVTGALFVVQAVDMFVYSAIACWGQVNWWQDIAYTYLARAIATLILSGLAVFYLSRIRFENPGQGRGSLDIIIAFFGAYGKAQALEQHLRESEERYRILFSGAADMIAALDENGVIFDANNAALRLLGIDRTEFGTVRIQELAGMEQEFWEKLRTAAPDRPKGYIQCSSQMLRTKKEADLSFSRANIADTPILIVFGRDMTEKHRLDREQAEWQEQSFHRQRLESIGRLAGGIAHDFNNFLHAMQGHIDIIRYMHPVEDPDVNRHLTSLDSITKKAATLTRQLLGFARKGNYNESEIELSEFMKAVIALFLPGAAPTPLTVDLNLPKDRKLTIAGDPIQLQQALLNILFNARYAMRQVPEQQRRIMILLNTADKMNVEFRPPGEIKVDPDAEYVVIRIQDTGPGISQEVLDRIFEPFFTTKPIGEGTGMGLAMAYGILMTHKGWIQAENAPEGGAVFHLFIPKESKVPPMEIPESMTGK